MVSSMGYRVHGVEGTVYPVLRLGVHSFEGTST